MRFCMGALILLLMLPAPAQEQPWSERFPALGERVSHLDQRLASPDAAVRIRVLSELTYFRPRDSKVYPPFLRALLEDPSPEVRGEALKLLREHHVFLGPDELPDSFHVHSVGEFRWRDPAELERVRDMAERVDRSEGGWAIFALGLVGDHEAIPLARAQLESRNVFVRHSAAVALVQLGQREEGMEALRLITVAEDDESGFYRYRAAEDLVRFGEWEAIHVLVDLMEWTDHLGNASGPREILEDLTGRYFPTAAAARAAVEEGLMPDRQEPGRYDAGGSELWVPPSLVGPESFPIVDQQINPGCGYHWVLHAGSEAITLTGGRKIIVSGTMPHGVSYTWSQETILALFGGPQFSPGETRTSGPFSTTGSNVQSFDFDTELDYTDEHGRTGVVRQRIRCVRHHEGSPPGESGGILGGVPDGTPEGIPGGIRGGTPGGVPGGILEDLPGEDQPVYPSGDLRPPERTTFVSPQYPEVARKARAGGRVILEIVVGRTGDVEGVKILRSNPLFDLAAVEAVKMWKYRPALQGGRPVRAYLTVVVEF